MDWIIEEEIQKDRVEKYIININQYQKKRKIEEEKEKDNQSDDKQRKRRQSKKQYNDDNMELSSEEEVAEKVSTIPRQIRSWYTIQDTYAQRHGYKVTPRLIIGRGQPEPQLM